MSYIQFNGLGFGCPVNVLDFAQKNLSILRFNSQMVVMGRAQSRSFCEDVRRKYPAYFSKTLALDIGALEVDGNNRYLFDKSNYIGIDDVQGPNVDFVSAGSEVNFPDASFDVAITINYLEYDLLYSVTLRNILRMIRPGGLLVFSCAQVGRPDNIVRRPTQRSELRAESPDDSIGYYKSLAENDIRAVLDVEAAFQDFSFTSDHKTCDLCFWGIKRGTWQRRVDYSFLLPGSPLQREVETAHTAQHVGTVLRQRVEVAERRAAAAEAREKANTHDAQVQIHALLTSRSWRVTKPLRMVGGFLRRPDVLVAQPRDRVDRTAVLRSFRLRSLVRRAYHALPLPQKVKWQLRERLSPLLNALESDRTLSSIARGIRAATQIGPNSGLDGLDSDRERALARMLAALGRHARSYGPVRHWLILPFLSTGGAEKVAINIAMALRELRPNQSVLLLTTDRALIDARLQLPPGTLLLSFDAFLPGATVGQRQSLLHELVRAVQPACVHNINSEAAWHWIIANGESIRRYTQLYASIFAFQFTPNGNTKIGYAASFLKLGLPHLDGLISDNYRFIADAAVEYQLTVSERQRLHVLYQPCFVPQPKREDPRLERVALRTISEAASGERLRVLWAGRLDAEKRIDLFLDLVRACPIFEFHVFGQIVLGDGERLPDLPNLHQEGPLSSPTEWTARYDFDAFVFTSRWEGMPNVLLEAGSLGLPIVAPTVGGVGELVRRDTGFPLPERPRVEDYIKALREIVDNPADAAQRAARMQELLRERHSWRHFVDVLSGLPGYVGEADEPWPAPSSAPDASIIIPCFNQGKYLGASVASALAAADSAVEVIVIDDGSTDPAIEQQLAEAVALAPGNVRVHRQQNGGLSAARNAGIELARGRYIQFLDADDVLVPGKLNAQIAQLDANSSLGVSVCDFLLCDESRNEFSEPAETIGKFDLTLDSFLYRWERGFSIPIHCGVFRRTLFSKRRFDVDARAKEDWLFWTALVLDGVRLAYVRGHWAIYRQHPASMRRSIVRMGRAWLQAGMKIDAMLGGSDPGFLAATIDWFEQCYRRAPGYVEEISEQAKELEPEVDREAQSVSQRDVEASSQALRDQFSRLVFNERPFISVVVPIYNHYEYLVKCLESIAAQSGVSLEVICIDDGSPDPRVAALLGHLQNCFPVLRVIIDSRNSGISVVQNKAVELARGSYVAFVDCDDALPVGALRRVAEVLDQNPSIDYLFTDRIDIDESGKSLGVTQYGGYPHIQFHSQDNIADDLLDGMVASHLKVIRREVYRNLDGCDPANSGVQDWLLALRVSRGHILHYLAEPLYRHRIHAGSVTQGSRVPQFYKSNQVRRMFQKEMLRPAAGAYHTLLGSELPLSLTDLKGLWQQGKTIVLDLSGPPNLGQLNFVREYNSYFDRLIWSDARVPAALFGYLHSEIQLIEVEEYSQLGQTVCPSRASSHTAMDIYERVPVVMGESTRQMQTF